MYMYILAFSCSGYTLIYLPPPPDFIKIEKFGRDVRGGGGFGNSDTPRQGEGGGLKIRDFGGRPL